MSFDMSQFLQTFYEESFEGLDSMEGNLLNFDVGVVDAEKINAIFRVAHSIKGGSATFGLKEMAAFTHSMETLLEKIRSGERQMTTELVDLLLQSVDVLRAMLSANKNGADGVNIPVAALKSRFDELLKSGDTPAANPAPARTGAGEADAQQTAKGKSQHWCIDFIPRMSLFSTGNDPLRIFRELATLGELETRIDLGKLPSWDDMDAEQCYLAWQLQLRTEHTEAAIKEIFEWVESDCRLDIKCIDSAAGAVAKTEVASKPHPVETAIAAEPQKATDDAKDSVVKEQKSAPAESASIRVSIDKVDDLINMVGELVITQSMLGQLGQDFDMSKLEKLADGLTQLERNTRELQESVMRIRMLPISFVFQRFPRMVRDLSAKLGKKVELVMTGEGTELDKTVMEKIGDPLVHLLRNALDHGIESPEQRQQAGKPATGAIKLNAYHQGGNIVIEIIDDGKGLDRDRILEKARLRGLVGSDEVLPEDKVAELIFLPGFSTAEIVSDLSGRGVGMDVVRKNIKSLGGSVEIKSETGKGSKFTIRLPLTLAILDGQLVRVGEGTYVVPLVSIIETLQIKKKYINAVAGKAEMYRLRDDYLPIIRLYETFSLVPDQRELENGLLVVVEAEGQKAGLFVDDLLSQQQVVIKSLETNFRKVTGLSGATILGDGTVALILDVSSLIGAARQQATNRGRPQAA